MVTESTSPEVIRELRILLSAP